MKSNTHNSLSADEWRIFNLGCIYYSSPEIFLNLDVIDTVTKCDMFIKGIIIGRKRAAYKTRITNGKWKYASKRTHDSIQAKTLGKSIAKMSLMKKVYEHRKKLNGWKN